MAWLADMLAGGKSTTDDLDLARVRDAVLFDRGNIRDKYSIFFLMLVLSSIIATGGIVGDSTAVVVGAMIITPLMTPMLAAALSIITGDGPNTVRSLLVTVAGAALVVAVAVVVTRLSPTGVQLAGNSQIAARTAPRVIDLIIALAAGAAGALAVARKDVSFVLPGVAVAISLVPPLCVAGSALAEGSQALALGALLLFATNFFAIQLAGGIVFTSMGFARVALHDASPRARPRDSSHRRRDAVAARPSRGHQRSDCAGCGTPGPCLGLSRRMARRERVRRVGGHGGVGSGDRSDHGHRHSAQDGGACRVAVAR